jgi:hypothetical protein
MYISEIQGYFGPLQPILTAGKNEPTSEDDFAWNLFQSEEPAVHLPVYVQIIESLGESGDKQKRKLAARLADKCKHAYEKLQISLPEQVQKRFSAAFVKLQPEIDKRRRKKTEQTFWTKQVLLPKQEDSNLIQVLLHDRKKWYATFKDFHGNIERVEKQDERDAFLTRYVTRLSQLNQQLFGDKKTNRFVKKLLEGLKKLDRKKFSEKSLQLVDSLFKKEGILLAQNRDVAGFEKKDGKKV